MNTIGEAKKLIQSHLDSVNAIGEAQVVTIRDRSAIFCNRMMVEAHDGMKFLSHKGMKFLNHPSSEHIVLHGSTKSDAASC
jgi:hypothetical protein